MSADPLDTDPSDPDAALVSAACAGDTAALETLLRNNYDRIYTLCRRMCAGREQAEDATQQALIAITRGLGKFDQRSRFSTWSYRVATNAALDELRRSARHRVVPLGRTGHGEDDVASGDPQARLTDTSAGSDEDPLASALNTEIRAQLSAALDRLDEKFRVPLILRDVGELDYSEIAEKLAIPPGTVRSRISRARQQLAQDLRGTTLDPSVPSQAVESESVEPSGNQNADPIVKTEEP